MRILYIIPGFDEGGAEVHVLNLVRELSEKGHEITIASSGGAVRCQLSRRYGLLLIDGSFQPVPNFNVLRASL